jgi:cobalamin biosynthesis protein CobD/CbiB
MYHAATAGILGGVVCTPLISVVAWVGMVLPERTTLHQLAPILMTSALVWLALAIMLAHACRPARERRTSRPLADGILE